MQALLNLAQRNINTQVTVNSTYAQHVTNEQNNFYSAIANMQHLAVHSVTATLTQNNSVTLQLAKQFNNVTVCTITTRFNTVITRQLQCKLQLQHKRKKYNVAVNASALISALQLTTSAKTNAKARELIINALNL